MSEETKRPDPEETGDGAPEETPEAPEAPEAQSQEEPREHQAAGEKKAAKKKKGYTFTREQVEQMELAAKQLESAKEQFVRLTAEYDNYRKRTAKEKDALWGDAQADTVRAFLPVYDNLERALKQDTSDEAYKKGVEMTMDQFKAVLAKLGVTEIEAEGRPFDPEVHDAVMHVEDESLGENTVARVFQTGFRMGERVIRHAVVQVAN